MNTGKSKPPLSVYRYTDFREYLRDLSVHPPRRLRSAIAEGAAPGSPAHLIHRLVQGRTFPSSQTVERLAGVIGLNPNEKAYFSLMIQNQKLRFRATLAGQKAAGATKNKGNSAKIKKNQFILFEKWYYNPVYLAIKSGCFSTTATRLGHILTPRVSQENVKLAVELFIKAGLVKKGPHGRFVVCASTLTTGEKSPNKVLRQYHKEIIGLAADSLERFPVEQRDIATLSLAVSKSTLEKVREELRLLRSRIIALVQDDHHVDRVYQINTQLFPLIPHLKDNAGK